MCTDPGHAESWEAGYKAGLKGEKEQPPYFSYESCYDWLDGYRQARIDTNAKSTKDTV